VYCRISRDRGGEGLGVERQERLCRELAARKSWPVAEIYIDNDLSAFRGKARPAYNRMLGDLASGTRDAVIVVDHDRLTRHPSELESFIDLADRHGIALANASGDVNLSTSDGRFRARIMGAVARQESERKSERIRRERDQAARAGQPHGGRRPFGYERGGRQINLDEAAHLREAARRFLSGEALRVIADDFNARGVRSASGHLWTVEALKGVLTGPRAAGLRVHRGEIIGQAQWPAILDRADWEALRAALRDPRRSAIGRPATNLLTGMLVCGRCGATLRSTKERSGARRYACNRAPGRLGCGGLAITAAPLDPSSAVQRRFWAVRA
jgi:site-specific DNA recombinase